MVSSLLHVLPLEVELGAVFVEVEAMLAHSDTVGDASLADSSGNFTDQFVGDFVVMLLELLVQIVVTGFRILHSGRDNFYCLLIGLVALGYGRRDKGDRLNNCVNAHNRSHERHMDNIRCQKDRLSI